MNNQRCVTQADASALAHLSDYLERGNEVECEWADQLQDMIATAFILPAGVRDESYVALHTTVTYSAPGAKDSHSVKIVTPADADPGRGMISVVTPIGMALIGRKLSEIVEVSLPANRSEKIAIRDLAFDDNNAANDVSLQDAKA